MSRLRSAPAAQRRKQSWPAPHLVDDDQSLKVAERVYRLFQTPRIPRILEVEIT